MPEQPYFPSPEEVARRQMMADLTAVAAVPADQLEKLRAALQSLKDRPSTAAVEAAIANCITDSDQAGAVDRTLQVVRPSTIEKVLEVVRAFKNTGLEGSAAFTPTVIDQVKANLERFIVDYPAIEVSRKADRLKTLLGNEFLAIDFVCDARPVFNKSREAIEAYLPLVTLRLHYRKQNDTDEVVEVFFTEEELKHLLEKGQKAIKKLEVLRTSLP